MAIVRITSTREITWELYNQVAERIDAGGPVDGLIVHTAVFDHDKGVFRIFDVWESREAGQRFMDEQLNPILERYMAEPRDRELTPPTADYWYELHDTMS